MRKRSVNKNTALNQLRLFSLLQREQMISIDMLSNLLDVDKRTIYRYLEPLQNLPGFENKGNQYRIRPDISNNTISFKEDEIVQLSNLLNTNINPILSNKILLVLTSIFKEKESIQSFKKKSLYEKEMDTIEQAIDKKKKILLKKYISRDRESTNRVLSPVMLDAFNEKLYALDDAIVKTFNLENIKGIEILTKERSENITNWNPNTNRDPFGFINTNPNLKKIKISLLLTNFAKS